MAKHKTKEMSVNKTAEFYQCLSHLKLFSKRQLIQPKANIEKVGFESLYFQLSGSQENPRPKF